jgi:vacuolar-type H+-ATPase subunit C/Vma6
MRLFVDHVIDLENLWTCLLLVDSRLTGTEAAFIDGGALLPTDVLRTAVAARGRGEATSILLPRVAGTPLALALTTDRAPEERVLRALIREQHDIARLDPLGPAPIIEFCLRLRAEAIALRRILWGLALEVPAEQLVSGDAT